MNRQYIGARYVPKFSEPIEWNKDNSYEALTIVTYLNNSYTSKKPVPVGVEITNTEYWVVTGNYNAQVEEYRQTTEEYKTEVELLKASRIVRTIEDYGAMSTANDNTTAIQSAINECSANGYVLIVPDKTYKSNSLELKDGLIICGIDENKSVIEFTNGGFTGDSSNNNLFNGGLVYNLTIIGNNSDNKQNGFNVCMITSRIIKVIARYFKGYGFKMDNVDVDIYQPLVNNGENHGLSFCSASFCGIGFSLETWDSLYENLVSSRCEAGIDITSGKLVNAHVWGFVNFGINVKGSTQLINIEIEAAISSGISGALILSGSNNVICNLYIWNININKFLIWCNNAISTQITGLVVGSAGNLLDNDKSKVQVIGGTCTDLYVNGTIDESYTSGVAYSVNGSGTYLLQGNDNITNAQRSYNRLIPKIKDVTYNYDGTNINVYSLVGDISIILSAYVTGETSNVQTNIYTYNSVYFLKLVDPDTQSPSPAKSYNIRIVYL